MCPNRHRDNPAILVILPIMCIEINWMHREFLTFDCTKFSVLDNTVNYTELCVLKLRFLLRLGWR